MKLHVALPAGSSGRTRPAHEREHRLRHALEREALVARIERSRAGAVAIHAQD
jgi:hypothetical protein